jgi:hypothetical protein
VSWFASIDHQGKEKKNPRNQQHQWNDFFFGGNLGFHTISSPKSCSPVVLEEEFTLEGFFFEKNPVKKQIHLTDQSINSLAGEKRSGGKGDHCYMCAAH